MVLIGPPAIVKFPIFMASIKINFPVFSKLPLSAAKWFVPYQIFVFKIIYVVGYFQLKLPITLWVVKEVFGLVFLPISQLGQAAAQLQFLAPGSVVVDVKFKLHKK